MPRFLAATLACLAPLPTLAQQAQAPTRVVHEIQDSTVWPEGVEYDLRSKSYFVTSVRRGTVMRIDSAGRATTFWTPGARRSGATMGVRVDPVRRVLWTTISAFPERGDYQPGDSAIAALLEIGLDDGRLQRRIDFPGAPGGHVLGDLALGPAGDVFISDSRQPVLYRLRPGSSAVESIRDTLFRSLQGVAPTPDGATVYLADYSRGLLRLDLRTNAVSRLTDSASKSLRGADGLLWHRGSLIAIHNGQLPGHVVRVDLDPTGRWIARMELASIDPAIADEPTIGTIVGDELVFVGTSQWEKHDALGRLKTGAKLRGVVLAAIRIR